MIVFLASPPPSWTIKSWIDDSISTLAKFDNIKISHAYREANVVLDFLANEGVRSNEQSNWLNFSDLSVNVRALLSYDESHGQEACHFFNEDRMELSHHNH